MVTIPPSEQWTAGDGASLGKVGLAARRPSDGGGCDGSRLLPDER